MARLLVSEAKAETLHNNRPLNLAILDSQKAFDVVQHAVLLDNLADINIQKDI